MSDKTYFFLEQDAIDYGVESAIIINGIRYWVEKAKANNEEYHDGQHWIKMSRDGFTKYYPFFNAQKIKRIMAKLVTDGVVLQGFFSENPYDRTAYYSLPMVQNCTLRLVESDQCTLVKNDQSIYNNNIESELRVNKFITWWSAYPRKINKSLAEKAFNKAYKKHGEKVFNLDHPSLKAKDSKFIPYPSTYLNQERYLDVGQEKEESIKCKKCGRLNMLSAVICVKCMEEL